MNIIIAAILQFPCIFKVTLGLHALTGLSFLWSFPITVLILISYDFGEDLRKKNL